MTKKPVGKDSERFAKTSDELCLQEIGLGYYLVFLPTTNIDLEQKI